MVLLVASRIDQAAMNIALRMERLGYKVHYIDGESTRVEELPDCHDICIFLSKHRSEAGKKSLTAHFPGNFSEHADVGGEPRRLSVSFPSWHKEYMKQIWKLKDKVPEYEIVTEPTHHGPTKFPFPIMYVEIGSSEEEWMDKKVGEVIAEALDATIKARPKAERISIGFGGPHYSTKFTDVILNSDIAIGHIMPKYHSDALNAEIMDVMLERCVEKVSLVLIENKSMPQKDRIINWAKYKNLEVIKV